VRTARRSSSIARGADGAAADGEAGKAAGSNGQADGGLVPSRSRADIQRREIMHMPKDVFPLLEETRTFYINQDKHKIRRDLVVIKSKDANKMVTRSRKILGKGSKQQSKLLRMMRHGRENFARDIVSERSRGGLRAFKYRSGMRDLRHEGKYRKVEQRLPDHKRKRHRWMQLLKKKSRWIGNGKASKY